MSNFIIRQEGPSPVVADNLWEIRLGVGSFLVGALAGRKLKAIAVDEHAEQRFLRQPIQQYIR